MSTRPSPLTVTLHPRWETVQAVVTAAAIVACADGDVGLDERRSLLRFLSRQGALARYGRSATLAAFACAVDEISVQPSYDPADRLRAVAGQPGARLVAQAAALVMLADGITWPQEIAMLEIIRDRVGLGETRH